MRWHEWAVYSFHKLEARFLVRSIEMLVWVCLREGEEANRRSPLLASVMNWHQMVSLLITSLPFSFCIEFWSRRILFSWSLWWKERARKTVFDDFHFSSRNLADHRRQQIWVNDDRWCEELIMMELLKRWMQFEDVVERGEQWGRCMWWSFIWNLGHQGLRKMAGTRKDCKEKCAVAQLQNSFF